MSTKRTDEFTILCPGEVTWDLWKQGAAGCVLAETIPLAEGGGPASFKSATIFGCPVTSAFAVPMWVSSTDPEIISSALDLHLEKLNLKPEEAGGELLARTTVETQENQTLLFLAILNEKNLKEFPRELPLQFEVSPSLFYLPDNQIILWKELEKIVVVITRGDRVVYFQALSSSIVDSQVLHDLQCLLMQLELQGVIGEIEGVTLWTESVEPGTEGILRDALGVKVTRERKPPPARPSDPSALLPHAVAQSRVEAARRQKIKQALLAAAAVYLLVAGAFMFFCYRDVMATDALKKQQTALSGMYGDVNPQRERWRAMLNVIHGERSLIYRFYQFAVLLDENSKVRLGKTTLSPTKIVISGEAQDQAKAITYGTAIKRLPSLADFDWSPTPPRAERNGTSTFQIQGTLKGTATDPAVKN